MKSYPLTAIRNPPIRGELPDEREFGAIGELMDLDAEYAWEMFGGKSLDEAYEIFRANPLCRQEDFMFMHPPAFAYYFPVLEKYLHEVNIEEECPEGDYELEDCQAWILGEAFIFQFDEPEKLPDLSSSDLLSRVDTLVNYVLDNLCQYVREPEETAKVKDAWQRAWIAVRDAMNHQLPSD